MGVAGHKRSGIDSRELGVAITGAHHGGTGAELADPSITGDGVGEVEGIGLVKINAVVGAISARKGDVTHHSTGTVAALITTKIQIAIRTDRDRAGRNHGAIGHGHRAASGIADCESAAIRPEGTSSIDNDRVIGGGGCVTNRGSRSIDFAPIGNHQTV